MIVTNKVALRIAGLVLLFAILQAAFFSLVEVFHVSFWILPACAVIFGLLGGSMVGATVGFSIGFLSDGLADGPLGTACLVFMGIGYAAGVFRERGAHPDRLETAGLCALATLAANVALGAFTLLLGFDAVLSKDLLIDVVIQCLYGFLLAFPIRALIVRVLRPALIDEMAGPRRRRRPIIPRIRRARRT